MDDGRVHDEPSEVGSESGEVVVSGPDGVAVSLTPQAAATTAARLTEAAVDAQHKKVRELTGAFRNEA